MRTAEFVSPKHPDKMCDRISDTLLDKFLEQDPNSRCGIETMGSHGKVWITGEVTSDGNLSDDEIIQVVKDISGIEDVTIHLSKQSLEISKGVDDGLSGDQGVMIGYACSETSTMMPFEYELARSLNKYIYEFYPYDGKTQVTINGIDARVVASFQNSKSEHLKELIYTFFKNQTISTIDFKITQTLCNPLGEWNIGGFDSDTGLTGRKISVDSYGPRIPNGGGEFSGKDATKIDRSAAYMARKIAVDNVKKYNLKYAMVELSYAIGYEQPVQAYIKGNEHGINTETGLWLKPVSGYDLSPLGIIDYLDLKTPIFSQTSQWGHFGNEFNWG